MYFVFDGILSIYDESKVVYSTQTNLNFKYFKLNEKIPEWNNELVKKKLGIYDSKCDWLDDYCTVFMIILSPTCKYGY